MQLMVCETFVSLVGETTRAGLPAFFIRLTGCNLRCHYCDTTYAYQGGTAWPVSSLVKKAWASRTGLVVVTGGEPLLQEWTPHLLTSLADAGLKVLLETNGSLAIRGLDPRVGRILDLKCPGSGMSHHNLWDNLEDLTDRDELKFVVTDRRDFDWALQVTSRHRLLDRLPVLISPAFGVVSPREASAWILESRLPLRLNLQLHKYIWGPEARGV